MITSRERNKLVTWKKKTVLFLEMHNTDADTNFSLCLLHRKAKKEYFLWIKIKILYSDGLKGYFLKLNRTKQGDFSYESLGATFGDEICGWKKANANFSVTLVEKKGRREEYAWRYSFDRKNCHWWRPFQFKFAIEKTQFSAQLLSAVGLH